VSGAPTRLVKRVVSGFGLNGSRVNRVVNGSCRVTRFASPTARVDWACVQPLLLRAIVGAVRQESNSSLGAFCLLLAMFNAMSCTTQNTKNTKNN
jgi:hypothetical protein